MSTLKPNAGKVLYALFFVVAVPAGLICWANYTETIVTFPPVHSGVAGAILMLAGITLFIWASACLLIYGRGLPMNAYPPVHFVSQGPYRLFRHPIYWGFGMWLTGWFVFSGSASGFWMVAPLTVLGMVALVMGYEAIDLQRRFPGQHIRTLIDIPEESGKASPGDRLSALLWVFYFLLFHNFTLLKSTAHTFPLAGSLYRTGTVSSPGWLFFGILLIAGVPFLLKGKKNLRKWLYTCIFSLCCSVFIGLLYPASGAKFFPEETFSFFLVPAFLFFVSLKTVFNQSIRSGIIFSLLSVLLIAVQLSQAPSAAMALADSLVVFCLSAWYMELWGALRRLSETIANSWHEWTFGKIRVINHGFYVGSGAFLGVLLAGTLAGAKYAWGILVFSLIVTVCSALWAQIIEGSDKLKRPFGYYGGLVGILAGSPVMLWMGLNVWVVIGVASVVMPWVQAMGRLRCLVNGCCHGSRTENPLIGIRYFHPRSRVCNISGLKGELVHPTQLYAILWLTLTGFVLLSLWQHHLPPSFVFGLYLILTGIGRFVEEAFRGEVQTRIMSGLRLYQWTAVISVLTGIGMTILPASPVLTEAAFNFPTLWAALITGFFVFFAMGVDFPQSDARFSRLV